MPNPRITQLAAELPFEKKIVGVGSILLALSQLLPWYQDIDTFRTGDTFTGLTGPLYLGGLTFLVISSVSLLFMVMEHLDKKLPIFKLKSSKFHLWAGIFSFYLLFLIGTVYFHPAFGVNITMKQSGYGMFGAYFAAALLTIGGFLEGRGKAAVKTFEKETREPVPVTAEVAKTVPVQPAPPVRKVVHPMIEQRKHRENLRSMQQAQMAKPYQMPVQNSVNAQALQAESVSVGEAQKPQTGTPVPQKNDPSNEQVNAQPYRMDL